MRINIVMGFFLPVPPAAGGATEKSWHRLATAFAHRGHDVTLISRRWADWPNDEVIDGVRYRRLPGQDHTARLSRNLWRDFWWSRRVSHALPAADVTVVNCIALPIWLGWRRGKAGKLVVMTGRMPKGQYRLYRRLDRVLAVSSVVRDAVLAENSNFRERMAITGYPINWTLLAEPARKFHSTRVTIGYVGRIHREKGLDLLTAAAALLGARRDLPPWRIVVCGPHSTAQGGSGDDYLRALESSLRKSLPNGTVEFSPAIFDEKSLARVYRSLDIFCYPSLAERGETFGVAVAEAMAAGAVPVVSQLACFRDFVVAGENGEIFDHNAPRAAEACAALLAGLILDAGKRHRLAAAARATVRRYDFSVYADRLLADFSALK